VHNCGRCRGPKVQNAIYIYIFELMLDYMSRGHDRKRYIVFSGRL